jgi:hypothetical protein
MTHQIDIDMDLYILLIYGAYPNPVRFFEL